jgi:hypothetical protein
VAVGLSDEGGGVVRGRRTEFTVEQYVQLGNRLKAAATITGDVLRGRHKSSEAYRAAWKVEHALGLLKNALDNEVCTVVSRERDPRALATKVFYGAPLEARIPTGDPADAFDAWEPQP